MAAFGRGSTGASSRGSAISSDTQKLLDSMMKDAGINGKKAQSIKQALNSTGSLPGSLASSSTMSVGKQYSSSSMLSAHRPGVMNPRNSDRGRKTKAVIDQVLIPGHFCAAGILLPDCLPMVPICRAHRI
jgi:hypothetical protein